MDLASPPKGDKAFQKNKKDRAAYKTFAVSTANTNQLPEMEQAIIQQAQPTHCGVCKIPFFTQTKRRECGSCRNTVCLDHIRKKRKIGNSWKRICDDCEDKILFENFMKLQIKAEQSIVAHQQIVRLHNQQSKIQLDARNVKMSLMNTQKQYFEGQLAQAQYKHNQSLSELKTKQQNLDKQSQITQNQHTQLNIMQITLPRALQKDYEALKIQDQKITKQLLKLQKRVNQLMQLMSKAEQQATRAYETWEKRQKDTKQKKKDDCLLF